MTFNQLGSLKKTIPKIYHLTKIIIESIILTNKKERDISFLFKVNYSLKKTKLEYLSNIII